MTKTSAARRNRVKKQTPPPKPPTKDLPIRITGSMIDRIDALKDPMVPREPWVRKLLDEALTKLEQDGEEG